jgi:hypothetical protein
MDERLSSALEFSNYMATLENQRILQYEKFLENCVYYFNGSKFTVTPALISFVNSLVSAGHNETVLIDDNNIPVSINQLDNFSKEIYSVYVNSAQTYLDEYNTIKKHRSVSGLVDL